jgi:GAF domain-containing protein
MRRQRKPIEKRSARSKPRTRRIAAASRDSVRLLSRDRDEALEQQAATSEILDIISRSPTDVQPVLDTIVRAATKLSNSYDAVILLRDGDRLRIAAHYGPIKIDFTHGPINRDWVSGRCVVDRVSIHVDDLAAEGDNFPLGRDISVRLKQRTVLGIPFLREGETIGCLTMRRNEVLPFSKKQVALLQTFAAQAVIAIENTRLFHELRESLQQQTATSDVLKTISRSTFDLRIVLDTLTESAARLCEADMACIVRPQDEHFIFSSNYRFPQAFVDLVLAMPVKAGRGTLAGRVLAEGRAVHIPDALADPEYKFSDGQKAAAFRSMLGIPLLRGGTAIGVIVLTRLQARPFTEKQIELVTTFADQAVIAIENVRLFEAEQQRTRELSESLEQQTATSEVLKTISSSPGELTPVFDAMLENATRLCEAQMGELWLCEGADEPRIVAIRGSPPKWIEFRRQHPELRPGPTTAVGRARQRKQTIHISDIKVDYPASDDPFRVAFGRIVNARTLVAVPMLKDDDLIGIIVIYRKNQRPFGAKQIALVENFAAQAVIAIENARLLNELRQRTTDLSESLEQQTATSEVLRVISSSQGDLEPVFNAMLENATRICEANVGNLFLREGDDFRAVAVHGASDYADWFRRDPMARMREHSGSPLDRLVKTKQIIHIPDLREDQSYISQNKRIVSLVETAGARTHLVVPMLKDNELVGAIIIYRQEVRPFTEKQIELVQNFAAQAVIAIENARLLNELRESLQQQTATSDVLKVISRSTFALQTVLDTLVQSAASLCEADIAALARPKGTIYQYEATFGGSQEFHDHLAAHPAGIDRGTAVGRALVEGRNIQILDVLADPEYTYREGQKLSGTRTILGVPLLREGTPIGVITLQRRSVRAFTEKQIDLVTTFADQAVIAIENARLLNELRQSLQQQTATADVLKVISRSTFDLKSVLNTLVESAARLCEADLASIPRQSGATFDHVATFGYNPDLQELLQRNPMVPGRGTITGRVMLEGKTSHIPDVLDDPEYDFAEGQKAGGYRTILGVPLMREGAAIGVLILGRSTPRPFTAQQIELAETFADQAVIAIENVRLFEAEQQRTRELARSLADLRTAQDRLVQTQKLASLGQLTAGIAHEIKNPLNFVNNFSGVSVELIDELQATLGQVTADQKTRDEIDELTDTLRDNLDKIMQHGERADSIVKNMLLHSREGSGEHRRVDINTLVEESLNLAYHGARAEKQGFNITLERSFDPAAGVAQLYPQEISRVLINLISNGFYAAVKRHEEQGRRDGFEPTLTAVTKDLGDRVEIRIRDNGIGIPPGVREKIFNPFFTTKPAGEGTGLGLSSHDIIVKQHSGSIEVDTEPGQFTEVRIILPRSAV